MGGGGSYGRVDFVVVSRKLFDLGGVVESGIPDSMEERVPSDHVPLWVKLRSKEVGEGE